MDAWLTDSESQLHLRLQAHYTHVGRDRVLHIDLADWADIALVAPCSANTLEKIANGDSLYNMCYT